MSNTTRPPSRHDPSDPRHPHRGRLRVVSGNERALIAAAARDAGSHAALWSLVRIYSETGRSARALDLLGQMLEHASETEERADLLFAMGQCAEKLVEWERAIEFYERARALQPSDTRVAYFVHNNLGFCLNQLGRFTEGEAFCRRAIEISSGRANAFKNLGLSLAGLDRPAEAARAYLDATRANPHDSRALALLEALLHAHEDLRAGLEVETRVCAMLVAAAQEKNGG